MDILTVEDAVVEKLQEKIKDIKIDAFPDNPDKYIKTHSKGAILVQYAGSGFSEPEFRDNIIQDRSPEIMVSVSRRSRRGHQGVYEYLDKVRKTLTGFQIPGCHKMYPRRDRFLSKDGEMWTYGMIFTLSFKATEFEE